MKRGRGFQSDDSHQSMWRLALVLAGSWQTIMKSRTLQVLISNNWLQNLNRNYVKGLIFIHDLSGPVGPSRLR